jgi:hypothetical protein
MPKLKNVTEGELEVLSGGCIYETQLAHDYINRIEQGYCDQIASPIRLVAEFLKASHTLASLAAILLTKAQLQEQRAEHEKLLRERGK